MVRRSYFTEFGNSKYWVRSIVPSIQTIIHELWLKLVGSHFKALNLHIRVEYSKFMANREEEGKRSSPFFLGGGGGGWG